MATNLVMENGRFLGNIAPTSPAAPVSGDPVIITSIPGVALTDPGDGGNDAGNVTVDTGGVYDLSVEGTDGVGNVAIAIGDLVYYNAGASPPLNVNTSGVRFGYALEAVAGGATATIKVKVGY